MIHNDNEYFIFTLLLVCIYKCLPLKQVTVDGANGVGAVKSLQLSKHLSDYLHITTIYDGSQGILNHQVGLFVCILPTIFLRLSLYSM